MYHNVPQSLTPVAEERWRRFSLVLIAAMLVSMFAGAALQHDFALFSGPPWHQTGMNGNNAVAKFATITKPEAAVINLAGSSAPDNTWPMKYTINPPLQYCQEGKNLKTPAGCRAAAAAMGLSFGNTFKGVGNTPYCAYNADARHAVFFNTAGNAAAESWEKNTRSMGKLPDGGSDKGFIHHLSICKK